MRFTVKYTIGTEPHDGGTYESFADASLKCLDLIHGDADSSWVELEEIPDLRSKEYLRVVPTREEVLEDLAKFDMENKQ